MHMYHVMCPLLHVWKTVGVKHQEGIPHSLPKANPIGRY